MSAIHLGTRTARATLRTGGGLLTRFDVLARGRWHPVLAPARGTGPTRSSAFPMVPWCNRLSRGGVATPDGLAKVATNWPSCDHPVHGTGWLSDWRLLHRTPRSAILGLRQSLTDPYAFECTMVVALEARSLAVTIVVKNTGPSSLPFGLGYHPYFPRRFGTSLRLHAARCRPMDRRGLPMKERPVAAPYDFRHPRPVTPRAISRSYASAGPIELSDPRSPFTTVISSDMSTWMMWAPGGAPYVCIDPMSHEVDAFASADGSACDLLMPGASMGLSFHVTALDVSAS